MTKMRLFLFIGRNHTPYEQLLTCQKITALKRKDSQKSTSTTSSTKLDQVNRPDEVVKTTPSNYGNICVCRKWVYCLSIIAYFISLKLVFEAISIDVELFCKGAWQQETVVCMMKKYSYISTCTSTVLPTASPHCQVSPHVLTTDVLPRLATCINH